MESKCNQEAYLIETDVRLQNSYGLTRKTEHFGGTKIERSCLVFCDVIAEILYVPREDIVL